MRVERASIRADRECDGQPRERRRAEPQRSPAGLLELQRTAGNRAVQRPIIGIQDAAEFSATQAATTIADSTREQKQRLEITESPGSETTMYFAEGEDEAAEQVFTQRPLGAAEPLVIVAHGSAPDELTQYLIFSKEVPPIFGGYQAAALAALVARAVPDQYTGMIYLSGCDTAVQYDFKPGTSFIEKFGNALLRLTPQSQPQIRGNMGGASTVGSSTETIEIPVAWIQKHPRFEEICQEIDGKWYVDSHTGAEATYWPSDRTYQSAFTQFL